MKNILFTLLIFSAISYSQNKEIYNNYIIEYDIILNTERPLTKSGTLILNNSYTKSFFYETKKGETKTITFELTKDQLGFYNNKGEFLVEEGEFKVFVGGNSNAELKKTFTLLK